MATVDPTKKLIQDLSVDLLSKLSSGVVKQVTEIPTDKAEKDKKPKAVKKKDVIAGIVKEIERVGVKRLADALNVADAQQICETVGVDFKDKDYPGGEANKGRKNVISKRLGKHVAAKGLEEVLTLLDEEKLGQQTTVLAALDLPASSGTARAIAIKIAAEVRRIGAEVVLSKMDTPFLKDLGEELSLEVHDISSQPTLIKAILTGKVPPKRSRPEKKQEPISKKKPKLEAGISIADMMQHYNLSELLDFARDNDIKPINGKKSEVMKRIHAFFEGPAEPVAKKTKKEVVKKEAKKETKKSTKKEAEAEEAEAEEEEEAEEEAPKEKASPKKPAAKKDTKEDGKAKTKKDGKKATKKAEEAEPEAEAEEAEETAEAEEEAPKEKASPKKPAAKKDTKKKKDEKITGER